MDVGAGLVLGGTYEAAFLGRLGLRGVGYRMVEGALGLDLLGGRELLVYMSLWFVWVSRCEGTWEAEWRRECAGRDHGGIGDGLALCGVGGGDGVDD
jgi:hypothetical protein